MSLEDKPSWLTHDFLRDLLDINEEFELTQLEYACAKGENFASKIYRAILTFKSSDIARIESIVVKLRPENGGFAGEFVSKFNVFPKEITMYGVIKELENIYQINGYNIKLAPK
jgi:Ecdysteroid kinase-like family